MLITFGSENDRFDNATQDVPLHVNSCGMNTTLNGSRRLADALSVYRPMGRKDFQLLYVTMGKAEHFIDGIWQVLMPGQAVLYRPGEMQRYLYRENIPVCCKWVHFSGSLAEELLQANGLSAASPVFTVGESREISELFDRMSRESLEKAPGHVHMLPALLMQIIALMGRQLAVQRHAGEYKTRARLMQAVESMHRNYGEMQDVEQYAAECGMSRYHFTHVFKDIMGRSPYAYLNDIRIDRAKELLVSSDMPIGRIAAACGYENPLYFSRFFACRCGVSPSLYRKQHSLLPDHPDKATE